MFTACIMKRSLNRDVGENIEFTLDDEIVSLYYVNKEHTCKR